MDLILFTNVIVLLLVLIQLQVVLIFGIHQNVSTEWKNIVTPSIGDTFIKLWYSEEILFRWKYTRFKTNYYS